MLHIVMCDDDQHQRKEVRKYLDECMESDSYDLHEAESGERLLELVKEKPVDIALLDIEMEGMNGIETGHKIRTIYPDAVIVYITSHDDYARDAFKVSAFQYLSKPLDHMEFFQVMQTAVTRNKEIQYRKKRERHFLIERRSIKINLPYSNILYFEKNRHKVVIRSTTGPYELYASFKEIMELLDMDCFVQCHQGYIVNVDKILGYKDRVITLKERDVTLPVSKANIQSVKEALSNRLFRD